MGSMGEKGFSKINSRQTLTFIFFQTLSIEISLMADDSGKISIGL
jgi:hypothetical protein